jgi:hypothetical protein
MDFLIFGELGWKSKWKDAQPLDLCYPHEPPEFAADLIRELGLPRASGVTGDGYTILELQVPCVFQTFSAELNVCRSSAPLGRRSA